MPIIFKTKNIDELVLTKLIRRTIILNGDNGRSGSGFTAWENFKDNWTLMIIPVTEQEDYSRFYQHLDVETSDGMAWGVTGQKVIYMFVNDIKNSFIVRQNMMPLAHELLHALYQDAVGTGHIKRTMDIRIGNTLKRKGQMAPAATVIVHEAWYGYKTKLRLWVRWGLIWLPVSIPYIPVKKAKELYNI